MKILESCNWILRVSKVPNIKTRIPVVVIRNYKLSRYKWIPHHLRFFWLDGFVLRIIWLRVEVVVVRYLICSLGWFCKLKNRLALLQIPNNNFSILGSASQNMRYNTIPADRCNTMTFMEVWLARFELGRFF